MKFYVRITDDWYQPKNNLHKSIVELCKRKDGTLISNDQQLQNFNDALFSEIRALNNAHKRCKPFHIEINSCVEDHDNLYISGVTKVNYLPVKIEL